MLACLYLHNINRCCYQLCHAVHSSPRGILDPCNCNAWSICNMCCAIPGYADVAAFAEGCKAAEHDLLTSTSFACAHKHEH